MPRPRVPGDRRLIVTAMRGAESWRTVHRPRVVQLNVSASRHEALQGMVRQAREGFTGLNIQHFNMFPPASRWSDGEVKALEDRQTAGPSLRRALEHFL